MCTDTPAHYNLATRYLAECLDREVDAASGYGYTDTPCANRQLKLTREWEARRVGRMRQVCTPVHHELTVSSIQQGERVARPWARGEHAKEAKPSVARKPYQLLSVAVLREYLALDLRPVGQAGDRIPSERNRTFLYPVRAHH